MRESSPVPAEPKSKLPDTFNTLRLNPLRIRLKNVFANILPDGTLCFEFLSPRRHHELAVIEVFEVSPDSQQITIVRAAQAAWPTSESQPPMRASCAPGRVTIFSRYNLPAKYHKKYAMAAEFVRVAKSRTPKVTVLRPCVKCVLMESGQDCVVTFLTDANAAQSETRVTMSPGSCGVASVDFDVSADGPSRLPPQAQEWYCRAAGEREKCREIEAAMARLGNDANFPVVVGNRRNVRASSTIPSTSVSSRTSDGEANVEELSRLMQRSMMMTSPTL